MALTWFAVANLPAKDEIAFDHYDTLLMYQNYLNNKFPLPIVGK